MQKAPVMKGSGLKPLDETKSNEEVVHIFGKNLEERVLTKDEEDSQTISFVSKQDEVKQEDGDLKSLKEQKFDTITGEEDEETVFQGDFKLFTWDLPTSNWIEKGRGQLKLNDSLDTDSKNSRLIMRVGGTLRIVLNVAIRNSFKIIANTRSSIRFTDSQTVWAASGSNAQQLRDLIDERLKHVVLESSDNKKRTRSDEDVPSKKTKSDSLEPQNDDTSDTDSPSKETKPERLNDSNTNSSQVTPESTKREGPETPEEKSPDTVKPSEQTEASENSEDAERQSNSPPSQTITVKIQVAQEDDVEDEKKESTESTVEKSAELKETKSPESKDK